MHPFLVLLLVVGLAWASTPAPSAAPSAVPSASPSTGTPSVVPTVAPTSAAAQVVNVTYNATVSFAVGGDAGPVVADAGDQSLRLDHATTAVNVSLTVYRHDDTTAPGRFGCGALLHGVVAAQASATRNYASDGFQYNLSWDVRRSPYTTPDLALYTCVAGELVTTASVCTGISVDQAPETNGTGIEDAVVCNSGYLALVEFENAKRTCRDGTYGCQCTRTDRFATSGNRGSLAVVGSLLLLVCGLYVLWNETSIGVPTLVPPCLMCWDRCYENGSARETSRCCCCCPSAWAEWALYRYRHTLAQLGMVTGALLLTTAYTFYLDRDERSIKAYWRCDDTGFRRFAWGMTAVGLAFYVMTWVVFFPYLWNGKQAWIPISNDNVTPDSDKQTAHVATRLFTHVIYAAALLPLLAATGSPLGAWYTEAILLLSVPLLVGAVMFFYAVCRRCRFSQALDVPRVLYRVWQPLLTLIDIFVGAAVTMRVGQWPCDTIYEVNSVCPVSL